MTLTELEKHLIERIRSAPAYADFEIMKRPTKEQPNGGIVRITQKTVIDLNHLSTAL